MKKGLLKNFKHIVRITGIVCLIAACTTSEDAEADKETEPTINEEGDADLKVGGVAGLVGVSVGVFGTAFGEEGNSANQSIITFEEIDKGIQSNITDSRNVVIDSQENWETLWREHQLESVEVPEIDFTNKMVIGVFSGTQSSGGYTLEIDQVTVKGKIVTISSIKTTPGSDCFVTLALTSPYHLIQIPKTGKDFQFTTQAQVNSCKE